MATRLDDTTIPLVSCEECRARVPKDEAKVVEAADSVAYFCGPECFDKWRAKSEAAKGKPAA